MDDCIFITNPLSGFVGSHNGRCSRGIATPDVHLGATHHVRFNGWCGRVCGQCADEMKKRTGAVVREIAQEELAT